MRCNYARTLSSIAVLEMESAVCSSNNIFRYHCVFHRSTVKFQLNFSLTCSDREQLEVIRTVFEYLN
jgi:hypothetical protein